MTCAKHSDLMDRTNRSAYAFRFGLRLGSFSGRTPEPSSVFAERLREERIAVVYEVAATKQESVLGVGEISGDLTDPAPVRRGGDSSDLDLAGLEVDYEQHEVANEPPPRDPFDREEVRRGDRSPMRLQEGLPPHRPTTGRIDSILCQDALDRGSADGVPEIGEGSLDSGVAPSRIVARHSDDQFLNLTGDPRSTWTASRASVVLLGDELPVPAEQSVRGDDRRDLAEASPSEWLRLSREAAALRIREAESPSSQLLMEGSILGFQMLDDVLLLAADPSDQNEQEELNRERHHDMER